MLIGPGQVTQVAPQAVMLLSGWQLLDALQAWKLPLHVATTQVCVLALQVAVPLATAPVQSASTQQPLLAMQPALGQYFCALLLQVQMLSLPQVALPRHGLALLQHLP